jgi:uncharacterized protein YjbI with pentapeptide repeats
MGTRFSSWWQQVKQHRVAIGVVGIVLVVVITLIIVGYLFGTGFNGYNKVTIAHVISGPSAGTVTRTEEYQPGKTLWDWLQLLIIPLVLAVAALLFNFATTRTERQLAKQRYEQDQQIALDKQREDLLQAYLDRMSELLLKEQLRSSAVDAEVRNVARVRTITLLFQLDARRIGYVFAFLREAGLMSTTPNDSIVSLKHAHLEKINFSQANLSEADLSQANLNEANLSEADLSQANLRYANLRHANLSGADLLGADLRGANLSKIKLSQAILGKANLSEANLSRALLVEADLFGANLDGANLAQSNLSKAKSLKGATMPDGSKHP